MFPLGRPAVLLKLCLFFHLAHSPPSAEVFQLQRLWHCSQHCSGGKLQHANQLTNRLSAVVSTVGQNWLTWLIYWFDNSRNDFIKYLTTLNQCWTSRTIMIMPITETDSTWGPPMTVLNWNDTKEIFWHDSVWNINKQIFFICNILYIWFNFKKRMVLKKQMVLWIFC